MGKNTYLEIDTDTVALIIKSKTYGSVTALIDKDDAPRVKCFNWYVDRAPSGLVFYVRSGIGNKSTGFFSSVSLHRLISSFPSTPDIDHMDGNGLNNKKSNLRPCSRSENQLNKKNASSGKYRGVYKSLNRFQAIIRYNGKMKYNGTYNTEKEAAAAFDVAARLRNKDFVVTNLNGLSID